MPHQCVRCKALYEDGSSHILTGCVCGCKLFFYIKKEKYEQITKKQQEPVFANLSSEDRKQIETDVLDILGNEIDGSLPIVLDIESINIVRPGTYELDLVSLFNKRQPLVYRVEEGKYVIDISNSFRESKRV